MNISDLSNRKLFSLLILLDRESWIILVAVIDYYYSEPPKFECRIVPREGKDVYELLKEYMGTDPMWWWWTIHDTLILCCAIYCLKIQNIIQDTILTWGSIQITCFADLGRPYFCMLCVNWYTRQKLPTLLEYYTGVRYYMLQSFWHLRQDRFWIVSSDCCSAASSCSSHHATILLMWCSPSIWILVHTLLWWSR